MKTKASLALDLTQRDVITLMGNPASHLMAPASPANHYRKISVLVARTRKVGARHPATPPNQPRAETSEHCQTFNVNYHVPFFVHPQKKGLSPVVKSVKCVKGDSCVDQLSFVQNVTNVVTKLLLRICTNFVKHMRPLGPPQGYMNLQRRLHPPLLDMATNDKVTDHHKC